MKKNDKYPIEKAAEKLLDEVTRLVKAFRTFVFTIPKNKMDKMIYVLDIVAWTTLTVSLILRIGR